ncbi:MAG: hypothetical protein QOE61_5975 [Micromonosporaceae bacterium]|jgi:hypothetical protein|nr:hypothetical protein [Micromonosporaceae bacterium]
MYDTHGVCEDKKKQIGVEIDADIGFFVDIKGWDKTGKTTSNTVFEVPLWVSTVHCACLYKFVLIFRFNTE